MQAVKEQKAQMGAKQTSGQAARHIKVEREIPSQLPGGENVF